MILHPNTAADMRDIDGKMWNALLTGNAYTLEKALEDGANPNARWTGEGLKMLRPTPLYYLLTHTSEQHNAYAIQDTRKLLVILMNKGADPLIRCNDEFPFQVAAKYDHPAVTVPIFKKMTRGIDKEIVDREIQRGQLSRSALGFAFRNRTVSQARELIKAGADPWKMQEDGQPCWIYLIRSSSKSMDYHRHPQAAHLAVEVALSKGSEKALRAIEQEVDLLFSGQTRQDGYGAQAMRRMCQKLVRQGQLDEDQLTRILACTSQYATTPVDDLLKKGANPNVRSRSGPWLIWAALAEGEEDVLDSLINHPGIDLGVLREDGANLADALACDMGLDISDATRRNWISLAQRTCLAAHTPTQPQASGRRVRL